jgi:hypothetical protein
MFAAVMVTMTMMVAALMFVVVMSPVGAVVAVLAVAVARVSRAGTVVTAVVRAVFVSPAGEPGITMVIPDAIPFIFAGRLGTTGAIEILSLPATLHREAGKASSRHDR